MDQEHEDKHSSIVVVAEGSQGELIDGSQTGVRVFVSVCVSVHTFKHEYLRNQSADFNHLKHHWGWGRVASGFRPDRIEILVSMATDSSYTVLIGKML